MRGWPRGAIRPEPTIGSGPLFADRRDAGRRLAALLASERTADAVVVGLARGGIVVAGEVARTLGLPLDAVAVRKVRHPLQPEYGIGAVTAEGGAYVRARDGLTDAEVARAVAVARARAGELDERIHARRAPVDLTGAACILVDDGLATGGTMVAAVRWARIRGARRVVAAVPVGAARTVTALGGEADAVVCPFPLDPFWAVGAWYEDFRPVQEDEVVRLLDAVEAR